MNNCNHEPYSPEWINALTDEARKTVLAGPFGRYLMMSGGDHVTWITWTRSSRMLIMPPIRHNGSFFFLDCGLGPIGVTAAHVYQEYQHHRAQGRVQDCQIGNVPFNPEDRLIDCGSGKEPDIATFRVTQAEVQATNNQPVKGTNGAWPQPPAPGETVFFAGFPGIERWQIGRRSLSFGLHAAMQQVTTHTEYQIRCRYDRAFMLGVFGIGIPPVGRDPGGMSGGPMLAPVYANRTWSWRLVGVISEAHMQDGWEEVTAVRAHFILPDGRIARG